MAGNDKYTKFLLHGDSIEDASLSKLKIENSGVKLSTEISHFKTKSLEFDGNSFMQILSSDVIPRSGDFTVDWWEYKKQPMNTGGALYNQTYTAGGAYGILIAYGMDSNYGTFLSSDGATWAFAGSSFLGQQVSKKWVHYAIVRHGNTIFAFKNGSKISEQPFSSPFGSVMQNPYIGKYDYAQAPACFKGYVDELRISTIARWTSNFVPNDAPYEIPYPDPPSNFAFELNRTEVTLSWSPVVDVESYNLYRDGSFIANCTNTSYADSPDPGEHKYDLESVNEYGPSIRVSLVVDVPGKKYYFSSDKTPVYLLDKNYDAYDIVDNFQSLIWAVRFFQSGEFEIYVPATLESVKRFHEGDYAWIADSDRLMIIEDINLQTDAEDGDFLVISGRSLESILERRIIWGMTVITGNFQNGIKTLLTRNVISPSIESRKIPNFVFKDSTDPRITKLTVEAQYFGENLYEEIEKLCQEKQVGFRILPKGSGGFEFSLYVGEDRSYNQIQNPWVVFAPNYENLQSSNYLYSKKNLKNATLVGGQGENWGRDVVEVALDSSSGLDRRELFTDASSVTNDTSGIENDDTLTEEEKQAAISALNEEYNEQLKQKGLEELAKTSTTKTFDGEIDATVQYVYRRDFDLGDIVQIVNAYGMEASSRVSEVVISHDSTGKTIVPTFTVNSDEKGDDS